MAHSLISVDTSYFIISMSIDRRPEKLSLMIWSGPAGHEQSDTALLQSRESAEKAFDIYALVQGADNE